MHAKTRKIQSTVQSIQRAAAILRSFTESEPELSVTALSQRLDLHKSTVSRILATLQVERLVGQNPETGKYRLGLGLISLAGVALGRLDVRGVAQPYLIDLVEVTQETINVTVLDGTECVNIEREASPKPLRYVGWIGRRTPLHCTASGKTLLAYMTDPEWRAILPQPLKPYTAHTVTDLNRLAADLEQVRRQGYAIVHEEFEQGFSAIAAPIFNHAGQVIATVSVSGPTFRMASEIVETFIQPLCQTTQAVSADMGYRGPSSGLQIPQGSLEASQQ